MLCGGRRRESEDSVIAYSQTFCLQLEQVREEIEAIFQKHRKAPGASFENRGFLRFLDNPPAASMNSSSVALRRRAKFFQHIEAHYLVAFPNDAYSRNWTFEEFSEWVFRRTAKRKVNLKLAEKSLRHNAGCLWQLFLIFGPLAGGFFWRGSLGYWIGALILVIAFAIGGLVFPHYWHDRKLVKRLKA